MTSGLSTKAKLGLRFALVVLIGQLLFRRRLPRQRRPPRQEASVRRSTKLRCRPDASYKYDVVN
jgi:hypothetical protein